MDRKGSSLDRTPVAPAGVGTKISARLGSLAGHVVTTASATYARIGIGSVEAKVLFVLDEGPMTAARISKCLGMDRAAISRTVKALVARGLLDRSTGSVADLSLTPKGMGMHGAVRRISEERERRLLARFTEVERAQLVDYLARLAVNVPELSKLADQMAGPGRLEL
ncbi:MAG: MarR family transcriptional regulator [Caulobacteraceae bacterium]|jgi:DNA-binding MarR family transcriptional regulator|nr:MarR family transcriptional regulator [Caulobacteraceae bacterium]